MGRFKRSYTIQRTPGDPVEGFQRLYFDSVVFDPRSLKYVCEAAGVDRMMMGSDFPFALGDLEPTKIIDACGFSDKDRQAIVAGNAAKLFRIEAAQPA